jgi:5-methylcytosine-specific restriction endonuclease McrA
MSKPCTVCGRVSDGPRCHRHPKPRGSSSPIHSDPRWTRLSRRMIARHVGQFGWVCPGDGAEHPSHPVAPGQLTTDHVIPLEQGGAPFDPANTRVMCKSWNSTLGARLVNAKRAGKLLPIVPPVLSERAQIRARFLG